MARPRKRLPVPSTGLFRSLPLGGSAFASCDGVAVVPCCRVGCVPASGVASALVKPGIPVRIHGCVAVLIRPYGDALGYRFGDCHVSDQGRVRRPTCPHVHPGRRADADIAKGYSPLVSSEYLIWQRPAIWARDLMGQSAYGKTVDASNVGDLLSDCRAAKRGT